MGLNVTPWDFPGAQQSRARGRADAELVRRPSVADLRRDVFF